MMKHEFSISALDFVGLTEEKKWAIPSDFLDVVDPRGDRFRDDFTRICLYLTRKNKFSQLDNMSQSAVIVATEYGNLAAMLRLQNQVRSNDAMVSAQQFPHATASSASTFINIDQKCTGGNVTLNAGGLNSIMGIYYSSMQLNLSQISTSHLLIGDTYCDEATEDIIKQQRNSKILSWDLSPGVLYVGLTRGNNFEANFKFLMREEFQLNDFDEVSKIFIDEAASSCFNNGSRLEIGKNWNRSYIANDFFVELKTLESKQSLALVLSHGDRMAWVKVKAS
jgi:hypothetical protein